ncbi:4-hydroxy-tetrahydrodipicolinate reductase [secondary endosymbiont of Ctenarytaina eucalypti]|uniref:4-hydroxy-tetrahydrodipicolinate reductase n=1 Tax=secondary endosymbiont of Ctenarytaina eucalypti TaxID=1199245 RepID=J3Z3Y1_9ENTR|nr:4-hydroxy-tetrahydrodipicolinate reductase [secondary endosymbiont of Ctenarytaina eucalypti]AFP84949.1 dihydrodipicolinate reductase [secondary endosymbiont of Ctenarytaina eucalypti]
MSFYDLRQVTPVRIAVAGAGGRMGRQIIQAVVESKQTVLGAVLSRPSSGLCGLDAGELAKIGALGVIITSDLSAVKKDFDIFIDFTRPATSLIYLDFCRRHHKGIVIGTTGFSNEQKETINAASKETSIVFAANFSVGGNLMLKLLEKVALVIGEEADIEILDVHHRHKVDAPSGTALTMGKAIAGALGRDFAHCAVYNRASHPGERKAKSIGFSTIRGGNIIGEHTAIFAEGGERLEITHKASHRITFARGAVRAAVWLVKHQKGLFDMLHVLNLNKL